MMECLTVSNLLKYYIIILDVIFGPGPTTMYDYLGGNRTRCYPDMIQPCSDVIQQCLDVIQV